jgi:hypothetical protein
MVGSSKGLQESDQIYSFKTDNHESVHHDIILKVTNKMHYID